MTAQRSAVTATNSVGLLMLKLMCTCGVWFSRRVAVWMTGIMLCVLCQCQHKLGRMCDICVGRGRCTAVW